MSSISPRKTRDLLARRRDQFVRHVAFVGEIDPRLDQRRCLDDLSPPVFGALAQQSLELPQRLPPLRFGVGVDQVVEAFRFGQIELAVLECAARELARFRRAHAVDPAELFEERGEHGAAAVQLQLGDVFAGRTVWLRKVTARPRRR